MEERGKNMYFRARVSRSERMRASSETAHAYANKTLMKRRREENEKELITGVGMKVTI
jgi:hypothetical protein